MARREARRRVARAISYTSVDIVRTGLVNASRRGRVRVLVDSTLQLLQELVDVQEIALSPEIGQGQSIWVMHRRVSGLSHHGATMPILRHTATLITAAATENWKLHSLETHKSLANVIVGSGVNCTAFSIAKKLVQCVVSRTLSDFVIVVQLLSLIDGIVHWAIGRVLWWTAIETSWGASRMLLAVAAIWTKGSVRILISTRFSILTRVALSPMWTATVRLGRAKQDRVISVRLDMLFEILGTLERLAAEVAFVRLQRNMNTNVRSNVITLDRGGTAVAPLTGQVQIVGALAANVTFTDVIVELLSRRESLAAGLPLADKLVAGRVRDRSRCCRRLLWGALRLLLGAGRSSDSRLGSGLFSAHG
jgi:hypothetical protein